MLRNCGCRIDPQPRSRSAALCPTRARSLGVHPPPCTTASPTSAIARKGGRESNRRIPRAMCIAGGARLLAPRCPVARLRGWLVAPSRLRGCGCAAGIACARGVRRPLLRARVRLMRALRPSVRSQSPSVRPRVRARKLAASVRHACCGAIRREREGRAQLFAFSPEGVG